MGIADDMKKIGGDLIASYDANVRSVSDLTYTTRNAVKELTSNRRKMAAEQVKNLHDYVSGLSKSVEDVLEEFKKRHKEMSDEQAGSLSIFVKNLIKDVALMLNSFQKDRSTMSEEQKNKLTKEVSEIETYVKNKLEEFRRSQIKLSEQQTKELAEYVSGITIEVNTMLTHYRDDLHKISGDLRNAAALWKNTTSILAGKRGVKPKVKEKGEASDEGEEELEKKMLNFLRDRKEGVKVEDMTEALGISKTKLRRISKKLLDEGKIRKEDGLYLPL